MRQKKQNKKNDLTSSSLDKFQIKSCDLTEKQKTFLKIALNKDTKIIFVSGPAGSSKTYISVYAALRQLCSSKDLDLLYIRTIIESAEKGLGALPGDLSEKFNPYIIPLKEKLDELIPDNTTAKTDLMESGRIDAMPINFLRGLSFKDKIVIMDEAQNATFKELTTLITRIGENSKIFICGDLMQSDINGKSGFGDIIKKFDDEESSEKGIHIFKFNASDIKRSEILKFIIKKISSR
jgi:phosphate starvation-inducible PhoH-like protein